ncbi:transglutaminase domain-containing protein [Streptomyces sp. YH02]|uniref:transglutaminase domain-containing protein n=1 Tax=Streptomyces sp. YH02 TaxID=3256999 RepID=UPI0037562F8A
MTSRLLMPFRTAGAGSAPDAETAGSTRPTQILDLAHPRVAALVTRVRRVADERGATTDRDRLRAAHGIIAASVRPVYSVEDLRRVSRTLRLGRGSCSQRMAVLEAVARSLDVPTRVRGLLVDGAFWYPRFPKLRPFVPEEVLLAWPEFLLDDTWVPVAELFANRDQDRDHDHDHDQDQDHDQDRETAGPPASTDAFTNTGAETLFEAVARTNVDWDAPAACAGSAPCDLSAHLRTDLGRFTSRDELFARHGQTLCLPARTLAEPLLGRWSAGAGAGADTHAGADGDTSPTSSAA